MNSFLKGTGVALVTPFDEERNIDYNALERLVEFVSNGGVDYLVVLGTTAETPTLFAAERTGILEAVKKYNRRRLPVILGIGGNNTAGVINSISGFDLEGVSAILSVTPFYNRPSQRGLYQHFMAIAEASPIPVILYNVPSRTGVDMTPETTLELARNSENIIAIKEACGKTEQFGKLLAGRPKGFYILSGDDCTAVPLIEMGGDGLISVVANACPSQISRMISNALAGKNDEANSEWERLSSLAEAFFEEGNPTGVKAALHIQGIIDNVLRLPLIPSTDALYGKISTLVKGLTL